MTTVSQDLGLASHPKDGVSYSAASPSLQICLTGEKIAPYWSTNTMSSSRRSAIHELSPHLHSIRSSAGARCMMVNGLHLYSTFIQSAVQLMLLIHTHIHTPTAIGCHARYQPRVRRHAQVGIEPATLRLPDNSSYLLSHIVPYNGTAAVGSISRMPRRA